MKLFFFLVLLFNLSLFGQTPSLVLQTGHLEASENESKLLALELSHGGQWALTSARDGQVKLWDAASGKLLFTIKQDAYACKATFANKDRYILAAGSNSISGYETRTARKIFTLSGEINFSNFKTFTDDRYFFYNNAIYSSDNGRMIDSLPESTIVSYLERPVLNKDRFVYYLDENGVLWSRDIVLRKSKKINTGPSVVQRAFFSEGSFFLFDADHHLTVVDANTSTRKYTSRFPVPHISRVEMINKDQFAILGYRIEEMKGELWIANSHGDIIFHPLDSFNLVEENKFSTNGKLLVYRNSDPAVVVLDIEKKTILYKKTCDPWLEPATVSGIFCSWILGNAGALLVPGTGKIIPLNGTSFSITRTILSNDQTSAASVARYSNQIKIWDPITAQLQTNFPRPVALYNGPQIHFSSDSKRLLTYNHNDESEVRVWDLVNNEILYSIFPYPSYEPNSISISRDQKYSIQINPANNYFLSRANEEDEWKAIRMDSLASLNTDLNRSAVLSTDNWKNRDHYIFSPDGSLIAYSDKAGRLYIRNVTDSSLYYFATGIKASPLQFRMRKDSLVLLAANGRSAFVFNIPSRSLADHFEKNKTVISFSVSPTGKFFLFHLADKAMGSPLYDEGSELIVQDAFSGKTLFFKDSFSFYPRNICFGPGDEQICYSNEGQATYVHDIYKKGSFTVLKGEISETSWSGDRFLTFTNEANYVWKTADMSLLYTFIPIDSTDYFTLTPAGYYMCTPGATTKLHYVNKDLQVIDFNQLDIRYNRPDKVLELIGYKDSLLLKAYHKAYDKRMRRLGIDTSNFQQGYEPPVVRIVNAESIGTISLKRTVSLHINARDKKYLLDRLHVYINGVPLYGKNGISLWRRRSVFLDTTVTVELSEGENKISVTVLNKNGIESYQQPLFVDLPKTKNEARLHFIGIGIDKFKDSYKNLQYSTKDIRDLSIKLKNKYGASITIDTLFNENVTIRNVKALKLKLQQTSVNDKVIISYSGHGLLSKDFDYYLSTYDINFEKPEEGGLSYDELENLLDSIPARKKLMLIDACHSGEVDKEELVRINKASDSMHLTKGGITVAYESEGKLGMKNSFELMQNLFVNVGKSTGATIISAAAGTQFALERGDLKNGVFTYCILEAMEKNKTMKISELKKIIGQRVEELTDGLQKPTSRNENISVDWDIW